VVVVDNASIDDSSYRSRGCLDIVRLPRIAALPVAVNAGIEYHVEHRGGPTSTLWSTRIVSSLRVLGRSS